MLRTKRVYDKPLRADGTRVLVMRLWPRGIRKSAVNLWLKDLGAEVANLRAFKAGRIGWTEMRRRYLAGLKREPAASALRHLRAMAKRGRVTVARYMFRPKNAWCLEAHDIVVSSRSHNQVLAQTAGRDATEA